MSHFVQAADKFGQATPPTNGAELMKLLESILSPQQLELIQYALMHPDRYNQVRSQFFAAGSGSAGLAAAAGGSTAPDQPMAPADEPDRPAPAAPPAGAPPVAIHINSPKPQAKRA